MRMEIVKGLDYTLKLIIKQDGSTSGLELDPSDTARFMLSTTGSESCQAFDWLDMEVLTEDDRLNGVFTVTIPATTTATLDHDVMFAEDKYPAVATYQAILDTNTVEQGPKTYIIPDVYVKNAGIGEEPCQS